MTQEKLNEMLQEEIAKAKAIGLQVSSRINPQVKIDKAKSRYGCCKYEGVEWSRRDFQICVSQYHLPNGEFAVRQTLAHEVLHTVKDAHGHGAVWKRAAEKMSQAYGYTISRLGTWESGFRLQVPETPTTQTRKVVRPVSYAHVVRCTKCGHEYGRSRHSNITLHPERYRCGECRGKLELVF